jgi:nucleotide-binding universal stress UspA family protein
MNNVKRILAVSRATTSCKLAVHYGILMAKQNQAKLFVMHVIHNPFHSEGWNLPLPSLAEDYKHIVEKARQEIGRLIKSEKAGGLEITELIQEGKPTDEIMKTVEKENIDLIVISGHPEGRLEHYLFGRTIETLTRKMPCSVLLVPDIHCVPTDQ